MSDYEREFHSAIINNSLPEFYLKRFKDLRFNYSDDIPEPGVSEKHPDYYLLRLVAKDKHPSYPKMKCRANVIGSIGLSLSVCIDYKIIDDEELVNEVSDFFDFRWNCTDTNIIWTTKQEIDYINQTLDKVIDYLQKKYEL